MGAAAIPSIDASDLARARVGVVLPVWKRTAHLPAVLRCLETQTHPPFRTVVVGSDEPQMCDIAQQHRVDYVDAPNSPLGQKWNAGFASLKDCDFAMLLGNDNLLGSSWIARCIETFCAHPEALIVGSRDLHVLELSSWRLVHFGYPPSRLDPVGAGRMIRAEALNAVDWRPCPPNDQRSLDASSAKRLLGGKLDPDRIRRFDTDPDTALVDVKDDFSVTSFRPLARRGAKVEADSATWLAEHFGVEALNALLHAKKWGVTALTAASNHQRRSP